MARPGSGRCCRWLATCCRSRFWSLTGRTQPAARRGRRRRGRPSWVDDRSQAQRAARPRPSRLAPLLTWPTATQVSTQIPFWPGPARWQKRICSGECVGGKSVNSGGLGMHGGTTAASTVSRRTGSFCPSPVRQQSVSFWQAWLRPAHVAGLQSVPGREGGRRAGWDAAQRAQSGRQGCGTAGRGRAERQAGRPRGQRGGRHSRLDAGVGSS